MPTKNSCFTLIELLVVIAIIAILAGMLLPALGAVKESGKRAACTGTVKSIGSYQQMYAQDFEFFPPTNYVPGGINGDYSNKICPATGMVSNQGYFPCYLAIYSPRIKGVKSTMSDISAFLEDFMDPAQDPSLRMTKCYVNANHYMKPLNRADGFVSVTKIPRPSNKVGIYCSAENNSADQYQAWPLMASSEKYIPGSMKYLAPDAAATKLTKIPQKLISDFVRGRHGDLNNTIWLDGHAETVRADVLLNYTRRASNNTSVNKSYNKDKRGPFAWTSKE